MITDEQIQLRFDILCQTPAQSTQLHPHPHHDVMNRKAFGNSLTLMLLEFFQLACACVSSWPFHHQHLHSYQWEKEEHRMEKAWLWKAPSLHPPFRCEVWLRLLQGHFTWASLCASIVSPQLYSKLFQDTPAAFILSDMQSVSIKLWKRYFGMFYELWKHSSKCF